MNKAASQLGNRETPRTDAAETAEERARQNYDVSWACGDPPYAGPSMADFARGLERELNELLTTFRHRHVNNGKNDGCKSCGLDLRHEIHEHYVESSNEKLCSVQTDSQLPNAPPGSASPGGSAFGETLDEWKQRHGIDPKRYVNQDELLMSVEESRSKEKSWCLACHKHMPVREMKLITRSTDAYVQIDEGETDYIAKTNRIRMCPACYKEQYE